jgi:uncharacterized repeat protein (TIGR01451 family)/CSLREA domain-containing protein
MSANRSAVPTYQDDDSTPQGAVGRARLITLIIAFILISIAASASVLVSDRAAGFLWPTTLGKILGSRSVRFAPTATGLRTMTVQIASDEGDYDFAIQGNGNAPTPPANLVVTKTDDTNDHDCSLSDCSLREAIEAANSDPDTNTITFDIPIATDPGCNGGSGPCTITLGFGELNPQTNMSISGPAAYGVVVSGANSSRAFDVTAGNVNISNLIISDGEMPFGGGLGTSSAGTLTITNCSISGNHASNGGGGINNDGTLTVINSTINDNSSNGGGAGIRNTGTLTLVNSTISDNLADRKGGGLLNDSHDGIGIAHITNSTITNNNANHDDSDSCDSSPCDGGGVYNNGPTLTLRNTIVAGNLYGGSPDAEANDIAGNDVDTANCWNNLIGTGGSGGLIDGVNGNQVGVADPRLGPLGNYGGPTLTHALLPGSQAIDSGDDCVLTNVCSTNALGFSLTTDQRGVGFPRLQGNHVDIGAVELEAYVVNTTSDHAPTTCDPLPGGDCTLREAINAANLAASPHLIAFNIPANDARHFYYADNSGAGVSGTPTTTTSANDSIPGIDPDYAHSWWSIQVATPLPQITNAVFIDGYTQDGAKVNTRHFNEGDDAILRIELKSGGAVNNGLDLQVGAEGTTISGLVINNFAQAGVLLCDNGDDEIAGNFIGTDVSGTLALGNTAAGIKVKTSAFDLIGGDLPAARNLISGHSSAAGVDIATPINTVEGNFIGTDRNGLAALENKYGVRVHNGGTDNVIGCEVLDGSNLISGNRDSGVLIDCADDNLVVGNFIGTNNLGTGAIANGIGVQVVDASETLISFLFDGKGNVISGNTAQGVLIRNSSPSSQAGGNYVRGNLIGTDITGLVAVKNGDAGVKIDGSYGNEIGCTVPEQGNVISGNGGEGVEITGGGSFNDVQGNFIGVALDGTTAMGNIGSGVEVYTMAGPPPGSTDNTIGFDNSVSPTQQVRLDSRASRVTAAKQSRVNKLAGSTAKGEATATKPGAVETRASVAPRALLMSRKAAAARRASIASQTSSRTTQTGTQTSRQTSQQLSLKPFGGPPSLTTPPDLNSGANIIANNGGDGVKITNPLDTGNLITENSIYGNSGLGINLVGETEDVNGVTANDIGDGDSGPNNLQNYPIITHAVAAGSQTISGVLHSEANTEYAIDFYLNATCDGSGYGEGATYIGSTFIATDGNGNQSFTLSFAPSTFSAGQFVTATARDSDGNTSEFSACFITTAVTQDSDISISKSAPATAVAGNNFTYTLTVSNSGSAPVSGIDVSATDTLPAGVTFVSASAGCNESGGTVTCHGSNIAPGASDIFSIVVTAGSPATVSNFATASAANDANPTHTSNTTSTEINSCPNTFTVTSIGDAIDASKGDGHCDTDSGTPGDQCTLRAAIEEANALPACGTITIDATGLSGTINLGTALPDINHDVNVNGPGANLLTVQRSSAALFRIFSIASPKTVSISGLTISNGNDPAGGGIHNGGTLTLTGSTVRGNSASNGGGIFNDGGAILNVLDSTLSNNTASNIGAGIFAQHDINISNSTVSNNTASGGGGGIYLQTGASKVLNSTISGNSISNTGSGGGILVSGGTVQIANCTLSNNSATAGGGITALGGAASLINTIVAGNKPLSPPAANSDVEGTFVSPGHNLIGISNGTNGFGNGVNGDQVGTIAAPINPLLGSLKDNGGPTFTLGLLYNSPALNAGDDGVVSSPLLLTLDQRGKGRNGTVDIGSYERQTIERRNVPDGQTVLVDLVDARLTFPCVPGGNCSRALAKGDGGQTRADTRPAETANDASIQVIDPSSQPMPPPGYVIGANSSPALPAFDVTGPGSFDTPVQICFYLPSITNAGFFGGLKILHNESGVLVPVSTSENFAAKLVCGSVSSLSPFVLAHTATPTAADGDVRGQIVDGNGNPLEGAAVRMSGTQNRLTVTDAAGNYRFDNVETNGFYTLAPARANYSFSPSQRSFSVLGQHTDATFNATMTGNTANPLDSTEYFVRQQYLDFLGREPDEAGLNFWVSNIDSCGADANCRAAKRLDTSAAFFLSIEFQQTGYLVYRTYQAAYGDLPGAPVPVKLSEFKPDTAEIANGVIVNQTNWQTTLEQNKVAFMIGFVQRSRFISTYPDTLTPSEFVDALFVRAGVTPAGSDRAAAINEFGSAKTSADIAARGRALRRVAENSELARREFNQAFVLMQYFGYLRRDANSRPDADFSGFRFWLEKLDNFNGNFGNAEMVKAFLVSGEYRSRFPR